MKNPRRLLVVRTDRMGDLLMSLPAIRALRRALPETQIHLLMKEGLLPLLQGHPDLDRLIPLGDREDRWGSALKTALWIRRERFDAVLVMNPSKIFHLASFLAGVPLRAGYRRKLGFLLNRSIPDTKSERGLHESAYNLELARLLGAQSREEPLRIPVGQKALRRAEELLRKEGLAGKRLPVAIHPWTSDPAKRWPLASFWETARQLAAQGIPVLLIGVPDSAPDGLPAGLVNLSGRIPLELLPALLSRCGVLLSNDSGPVHVAAAVGTPAVVVAPREHARLLERWRPLGSGHRILITPDPEEAVRTVRQLLEAHRAG